MSGQTGIEVMKLVKIITSREEIKVAADVSVMSLEYNDEQQAFNANFDVIKQCRNFDVIHDWAKAREAKYKPP